MRAMRWFFRQIMVLLLGAGALGACAEGDPCAGPTRCPADGPLPHPRLSDYDFFQGPLRDMRPKDGVIPYTVVSPLWADQAEKGRFIVLPPGEKATFGADGEWLFPDGTIIIKTFYFDRDRRDPAAGARVIETRLLIREAGAWRAITYLWDDEETDATAIKVGTRVDVDFIDVDGVAKREEYIVPNLDRCDSCHARHDATELLGVITPQLNYEVLRGGAPVNQLEWLADQGVLDALPPLADQSPFADPMDPATGDLDARARAYLHANCAHCHRDGGGASKSGLILEAWEQDPLKIGICKVPAAAGPGTGGRKHDIVPGAPDESIMIFRMNSTDPEIKMPELPNRVINTAGVALIAEWIAAMPARECGAP